MLSTNALKTILHVLRLVVETLKNDAKKSFSSEQSSRTPVQPCPTAKQEVPKDPNHLTRKNPKGYPLDAPVRQNNAKLLSEAKRLLPTDGLTSEDLKAFTKHYEANKVRYEAMGKRTNLPPDLIAALFWREAKGDFNCMMSNGSPLDKPSPIEPHDGPYNSWEDSAIAALNSPGRQSLLKTLELDKNPNDLVALATFAETYNGAQYSLDGVPSPYVFSGTDVYSKGKYTTDGVLDPNFVDTQIGVVPMLVAVRGVPATI